MKISYHQDLGNGWFAVREKDLISAGVSAKISHKSYKRGSVVFLDEDHDAETFFQAIDRSQLNVKKQPLKELSLIRSFQPYII